MANGFSNEYRIIFGNIRKNCNNRFCYFGKHRNLVLAIQTHLYLNIFNLKVVLMTEFSKAVVSCIVEWSKGSTACNGNTECLEQSARQLRQCLDAAFPDSKKVELESDKVNYMLSSVFFLANRLSKAVEGLAEFDRVMNGIEKVGKASLEETENQELHTKFQKELDDILGKYF
jgi:hypothetical protein